VVFGVTRHRWIGLLALVMIVGTVAAVGADEGVTDSAGEQTIDVSQEAAISTITIDDDTRATFYPGFAFRLRSTESGQTISSSGSSGCVYGSSSTLFATEVDLPDGARVDEVALYADDTSAGSVTLYLTEFVADSFPGSGSTFNDVFAVSSSGEVGRQVWTDTTPDFSGNEIIDTANRSYVLQVRAPDVTRQFCGVRVLWSIPDPGLVFHPLTACKIYDSRTGKGGRGTLEPNEKHRFSLLRSNYSHLGGNDSDCGVPADADALLVSINVLSATKKGGIRVWPKGESAPKSNTIVFDPGTRTSSAVPVVAGTNDKVLLRNNSKGETNVQLIVLGWYGPPKS